MKNVKLLGINDDVTTCECCGKSGLKKTVVLEIDGSPVHYSTNCAARSLRFGCGARRTAKAIADEARLVQTGSRYASAAPAWMD